VYVVIVNGRLCVLMAEMGCFEFPSSYVDVDAMRVYALLVSSSLGGLFFLAFCDGFTGRVPICYSLLAP
jgi:hypothetical protein